MPPKTILITGCSAGSIGSALTSAFFKYDFHVFATARSLTSMAHLSQHPKVTLLTLDVTNNASIFAAAKVVRVRTGGRLDYLVNAHGSFMVMPILDTNIKELKRLFDSNVFGTLAVIKAFSPLLIASKGTIINISSMAGHFHAPWLSAYGASKGSLTIFSETLRLELEPLGVKVITVEGGSVQTNLMKSGDTFKLPKDSLYKSIQNKISWFARGDNIRDKMSAEEFAQKVVGDVLGGKEGRIWRGKMATILWYLIWIPVFLMDYGLVKVSGLGRIGNFESK